MIPLPPLQLITLLLTIILIFLKISSLIPLLLHPSIPVRADPNSLTSNVFSDDNAEISHKAAIADLFFFKAFNALLPSEETVVFFKEILI